MQARPMNYRLMGRSGLGVSDLALSAAGFGARFGTGPDKSEARGIFDAYMEAGGNLIDLSCGVDVGGNADAILGLFLAESDRRDQIALAVNCAETPSVSKNPILAGNHRKAIVRSVERSLSRLCTDYIDLLWVRARSSAAPIDEVMRALDDLVRQGKVLHLGLVDGPAWVLAQANTLAAARGWTPFSAVRVRYSLLDHSANPEMLPAAAALGVGAFGYFSETAGATPDKWETNSNGNPSEEPGNIEMASFRNLGGRDFGIAQVVKEIAREIGGLPSQVSLNWMRAKGIVPVLQATRLNSLKDDLGCLHFHLNAEHVARLDSASRPDCGVNTESSAPTRRSTTKDLRVGRRAARHVEQEASGAGLVS